MNLADAISLVQAGGPGSGRHKEMQDALKKHGAKKIKSNDSRYTTYRLPGTKYLAPLQVDHEHSTGHVLEHQVRRSGPGGAYTYDTTVRKYKTPKALDKLMETRKDSFVKNGKL